MFACIKNQATYPKMNLNKEKIGKCQSFNVMAKCNVDTSLKFDILDTIVRMVSWLLAHVNENDTSTFLPNINISTSFVVYK